MNVTHPESQSDLAAIPVTAGDPDLVRAGEALRADDIETAEFILRGVLNTRPEDVVAIGMLGETAARVGIHRDAEQLFRRALELNPGFDTARFQLAKSLRMQNRPGEALAELDQLGPTMRANQTVRNFRAFVAGRLGNVDEALAIYRELIAELPDDVRLQMSLAYYLQISGEQDEAIAIYRRILAADPGASEAWWRLANLKTFQFTDEDVGAMEAALNSSTLTDRDRMQLNFALGKALEDRREDERAFAHYREGNAIGAREVRHDPESVTDFVETAEQLFTPELFAARADAGCDAADPIFIVGLPRSGSTLVEQILASHPMIEGTAELGDIVVLARSLEKDERLAAKGVSQDYPGLLADLASPELKRLGQLYIDRTRARRHSDRPHFTDKMPINWVHVGFIKLILPNAKIVDVRRHPLASGFSNFKHHFANKRQDFSYDLSHIGSYYRDYVRMMRHFDEAAPGSIHHVIHERLVAEPESEIARLLEYIGVPFDEACLRFYENDRPVRTPSAEQVRKPLDASSTELWRRYEQWLDPLKQALGPTLDDWQDGAR